MKKFYTFVILNDAPEGGFHWGEDRMHIVGIGKTKVKSMASALDQAKATEFGSYDDVITVAAESPEEALCEAPSAGSADAWEDDIWLGIADYLSTCNFAEILGVACDYTYPDWERITEIQGNEAIEAAREYLPAEAFHG